MKATKISIVCIATAILLQLVSSLEVTCKYKVEMTVGAYCTVSDGSETGLLDPVILPKHCSACVTLTMTATDCHFPEALVKAQETGSKEPNPRVQYASLFKIKAKVNQANISENQQKLTQFNPTLGNVLDTSSKVLAKGTEVPVNKEPRPDLAGLTPDKVTGTFPMGVRTVICPDTTTDLSFLGGLVNSVTPSIGSRAMGDGMDWKNEKDANKKLVKSTDSGRGFDKEKSVGWVIGTVTWTYDPNGKMLFGLEGNQFLARMPKSTLPKCESDQSEWQSLSFTFSHKIAKQSLRV